MAYFAPEKLNRPLTILILFLYAVLTIFMFSNFLADADNLNQVSEYALALAAEHGLPIQTEIRTLDVISAFALGIFALGLCFGTIGYIWHVSSKNAKLAAKEESE